MSIRDTNNFADVIDMPQTQYLAMCEVSNIEILKGVHCHLVCIKKNMGRLKLLTRQI